MGLFSNPGKVDVEKAAESIVENGGGMSSTQKGDHIHHTAYSRDEDRHLSWDEDKDGNVSNVHTDKNGRSYTDYGKR